MNKKVIEGLELRTSISREVQNKLLGHKGVVFLGSDYHLPLIKPIFSQHILFSGGIGSGKTNAINGVLKQLIEKRSSQDVFIVFDSKGDFLKTFSPLIPTKEVISNDANSTVVWNMFNEALIDINKLGQSSLDENLMELANSLFQTIIDQDKSNPFFPLAAKNIFYGMLKVLHKELMQQHISQQRSIITNQKIHQISKLSTEDIALKFNSPEHRQELGQLINYLGRIKKNPQGIDEFLDTNQGASVVATLRNVLIDIFKGQFAKAGNFSIREFVRNKGGKFLFIEYDLNQGKVLAPIYKVLFDMAIKESLSREKSDGNVFFIIDEFRLLPKLDYMDAGVNLGRSLGCKFIVGIQNLKQIEAIYGEAEAMSILSGFVTNVNFRTTDRETRDYIKSLSGDQIYEYDVVSLSGGKQRDKSSVITDEDILKLNVGQAIVNIPVLDKNPIKFQFKEFKI